MHVRVDADVLAAAVREDEHEIRRLAADTRQRQQIVHCVRHLAAEPREDLPARRLHVPRFDSVKADRIDQPFDLLRRELRHRARRARDAE